MKKLYAYEITKAMVMNNYRVAYAAFVDCMSTFWSYRAYTMDDEDRLILHPGTLTGVAWTWEDGKWRLLRPDEEDEIVFMHFCSMEGH